MAHVKKTLINDLTFRMPQHTSSEVTVGYALFRQVCYRSLCMTDVLCGKDVTRGIENNMALAY